MNPTHKPPAKRLYKPGLGGVGTVDAELELKRRQDEATHQEAINAAKTEVEIQAQLASVIHAMSPAQRAQLHRKRKAQARLNAKLSVHRHANEKETALAMEQAAETAFEKATRELNDRHLERDEHDAALSELIAIFYPAPPDKVPSMSRGSVMTGAPRGLGRLVIGGYDGNKLTEIYAASLRDHGGGEPWLGEGKSKRVRAEGNDNDDEGGVILANNKGIKYVEDKPREFDVKLADIKLTPKQMKLERLISKHKTMLAELWREYDRTQWHTHDREGRRRTMMEDVRLKFNFLDRVAAGLIPEEIAARVVPMIERDLAGVTG